MVKRTDRIAIGLIIALMVMQLSLYKILAGIIPVFNYSYNTPFLSVLYVLMIAGVYACVFVPRLAVKEEKAGAGALKAIVTDNKYLVLELVILLLAIISTDTVTLIKHQLRLTNILTHNLDYFYAFLALPVIVLLKEGKWKIENIFELILALSVASMFLRIFAMVYFGATGVEIECITRESAGLWWYRNDRIRVTPPCFILICAPIAMYMLASSHAAARSVGNVLKKIWYIFAFAMSIFYIYYVWQSRAALIFAAGGIAVMLLFRIMPKKSAVISWSIVAVLAVAFVALGGIGKVMAQFSTDDTAQYVGENRGHFVAYAFYWARYLKCPIFGEGLSETLAEWFSNGRAIWMCDAGIMYSLLPMGVIIAVFFLLMFGRGIYAYVKGCRTNLMAVLAFGCTMVLMVGEVSMDCFFTPSAFMVPFYLVIVEWVMAQNKRGLDDKSTKEMPKGI